jgi:hypothetical protein
VNQLGADREQGSLHSLKIFRRLTGAGGDATPFLGCACEAQTDSDLLPPLTAGK